MEKIIFPHTKCKSLVPESYIHQMKEALKAIDYGDSVIGPKNADELFNHNKDIITNYPHSIFDQFLKEKIILDYNTIKDGLELLEFYKSNNKNYTAFEFEVEKIAKLYETKKVFSTTVKVSKLGTFRPSFNLPLKGYTSGELKYFQELAGQEVEVIIKVKE